MILPCALVRSNILNMIPGIKELEALITLLLTLALIWNGPAKNETNPINLLNLA